MVDTTVNKTFLHFCLKLTLFAYQMQEFIRIKGPSVIGEQHIQKFIQAYEEGKLVKPEDAGHVIASLSLKAPRSLTGRFINWNGDGCK